MADLDDKPLPPEEEEELETKPFLDHLEDLRWTILKSITALFVGMCIAFYGNPWIMDALESPLWGIRDVIEQPPLFHLPDLRKAASFVVRLKEASDPVSQFLLKRFSPETKKQLGEYDPQSRPSKSLREALVDELNKVIQGKCIYSPELFAKVDLGDETHDLLQKNPGGKPLIRLNRLLLEDAYPREIERAPEPTEFDPRKFLWPTTPGEPFIFSFKLAFYGGMVLALPFILYYIGQFILPALTRREKRYLWPAFSIGGGLFLVGAGFCFFYVMPRALMVSVAWAEWTHLNVTFWRVGEYVGFVTAFMIGMGLAFETPVVLLSLVKMGILSHAALKKGRRYWVVISLVAGSVLTTPEVFTQVVMAIVLIILYEISIWGAWFIERRERAHQLAAEKAEAAAAARNVPAGVAVAAAAPIAAAGAVAAASAMEAPKSHEAEQPAPPVDPDVPAEGSSGSYGGEGYGIESETGDSYGSGEGDAGATPDADKTSDAGGESKPADEDEDTMMH